MRLENWLEGKKSVALAGHVRPDGDCVGSTTAVLAYIEKYFPNIEVYLYLDDIPTPMNFIAATSEIRHEVISGKSYDLAIALDCGDLDRLGFAKEAFENAKTRACIDHHVSNDSFGDINYIVPTASSTCELVYDLLDKDKITKEIAESLYMGIVHDTGVFQYSCASPKTFRIAANLLETGIDAPKIITDTFYEKTYVQNLMLGYGLLNSKLHLEGRVVSSVLGAEVFERFGACKNDVEGVVANIRKTKDVEIAIFLYETKNNGEWKASLRAKEYADVNKIAAVFGGGGHKAAAGCTIFGNADEILEKILDECKKQL